VGEREGAGEKGGEMTQTLYAHMNKRKKMLKKKKAAGRAFGASPSLLQRGPPETWLVE
jgi:hypothetical protein